MNKEISLKKFFFFWLLFLIIFSLFLYFLFDQWKPICKKQPCEIATCNSCSFLDGKKVCNDCNLYDDEQRKIWTGRCIFKELNK